jgi:hypothetical protein
MTATRRPLALRRAALLAVLSAVAFVLVLVVIYELTGDPGTTQGIPRSAATAGPAGF